MDDDEELEAMEEMAGSQILLGFAIIALCAGLVGAALMALIWWLA